MKARIPGGHGGGQNMNAMLKQAQKMQEDMAALQADIEQREFTAAAGGGICPCKTGRTDPRPKGKSRKSAPGLDLCGAAALRRKPYAKANQDIGAAVGGDLPAVCLPGKSE